MTPEALHDWQIGDWTLHPNLNRIVGPGGSFGMTPKALATLLCLAEHYGDVVSRETLFDTVWADTVVSDDTLNRAISDLRQLFGDSPQAPRVIETIRQRGYRLLLPAHPIRSSIRPGVNGASTASILDSPTRRWGPRQWFLSFVLFVCAVGFSLAQFKDGPGEHANKYLALPLTTSPGFEFDVALSFDGEQVAFAAADIDAQQMDLFIKQVGVETPQQITDSPRIEISPGWAPDGRSIAFLAGDRPNGPCGLIVMQLPGGDERKVADCKSLLVTGVSWSPDGKGIVFSDRESRDKPFRIYLVDVASRVVTAVTDPAPDLYGDFSATFSPDGRSVAFIRGTVPGTTALILVPAVGDIHTVRLDTGEESRLTHDGEEIPHIDWTSDGKQIIFASHRERGTPGLWKIPAKGGRPIWLFGGNGFVRKPMLARNSNRLVFEQWDSDVSIWQTRLDSASSDEAAIVTPLINSTRFDATPQYSPDGTRLAFTSQRSGASEIWVSNSDGGSPIQLTSFGGPFTSTPRWSPNGSRIAFETRTEGQTDVYVVDSEGGPARQLTMDSGQDMVPSWSPDGDWIYNGSNRSGTWQVWKTHVDSGESAMVTSGGGFLAIAAPADDHPMIYYSRIDAPGLYRVPRDGGVEEKVLEDLFFDDWGNWMAASGGIYYYRRIDRRLAYYSYSTGVVHDVVSIDDLPYGMVGLSISPDELRLAFVKQRFTNADLWMIDDFD